MSDTLIVRAGYAIEDVANGLPINTTLVEELIAGVERHGECICDCNPETTDGPDEFCPRHGRPYRELLDVVEMQAKQLAAVRDHLDLLRDINRSTRMAERPTNAGCVADWIDTAAAILDRSH